MLQLFITLKKGLLILHMSEGIVGRAKNYMALQKKCSVSFVLDLTKFKVSKSFDIICNVL